MIARTLTRLAQGSANGENDANRKLPDGRPARASRGRRTNPVG